MKLDVNKIMEQADRYYFEMNQAVGRSGPDFIPSTQVRAFGKALVEAINEAFPGEEAGSK